MNGRRGRPTDVLDEPAPEPPRPRVAIDPRIRERRIAVRRDEGRRRLRLILAAMAIVSAVLLGWGITRSPLMAVQRVDVIGSHHTTVDQIVDASGLRRGQAMTDVDEPVVEARIRRLPWIARAHVARSWPRTVHITVMERVPAATVRAKTSPWMLVDAGGRFLENRELPVDDLPAIEGTPPAVAPGGQLDARSLAVLKVATGIPADRVPVVRVVAVRRDGTIELRLATPPVGPGGIVEFGPPDQVHDKLIAVFTVLDRVDTSRLAVLDVRVPNAPVIRRNS